MEQGLWPLRSTVAHSQARVGDPIEETFTAINESLLPKHNLEVEDISDLPGYSGGVAVSLKSNGSRTWSTGATARKRGLYTLGPVRVSVADPFSVFRRERLFGGTDTLTIFPQTHDLPGFEVPSSGPLRRQLDQEAHARRYPACLQRQGVRIGGQLESGALEHHREA